MKITSLTLLCTIFLLGISCKTEERKSSSTVAATSAKKPEIAHATPQDLSTYETAYFASGCFWCVEAIFESVKGVKEVVSGYSGGQEENPTYEQVSYGNTSHAEAVEVYYDPKEISFMQLVQVFFGSHDPTSLYRQGPDRGPQYRSIAFYKNKSEQSQIERYVEALEAQKVYAKPIVTEVKPFEKFYKAEEYHQDYERKNPNNSYIRNVSVPRLNRFKANFETYLKENAH